MASRKSTKRPGKRGTGARPAQAYSAAPASAGDAATQPGSAGDPGNAGETDSAGQPVQRHGPDGWLRLAVSVGVLLHLTAIAGSYLSVVSPSETQGSLMRAFDPYLQLTHFGADGRPIYLAAGGTDQQPLRLEVSESLEPDESDWEVMDPPGSPGMAGNDRYARWLASAVLLAESEQPSLVAELLAPVLSQKTSVRSVRIVRLPTLLTTEIDDATPPPYFARVVRSDDGTTALIANQELRLSAVATGGFEIDDPSLNETPAAPVEPATEGSDVQ